MSNSILTSIKKLNGVPAEYTVFDVDFLLHINGVLATLNQLGVGPSNGFMIEDAVATWADFLGPDPKLNNVKQYVALKVRLAFDPPQTSFGINAIEAQLKELEWRINAEREATKWINPDPNFTSEDTGFVLDGGAP